MGRFLWVAGYVSAVLNAGAAAINGAYAVHWWRMQNTQRFAISVFCAAFNATVLGFVLLSNRRYRRTMVARDRALQDLAAAEIHAAARHAEFRAMAEGMVGIMSEDPTTPEAVAKARVNLEKVVKAVGAVELRIGGPFLLQTSQGNGFVVDVNGISRVIVSQYGPNNFSVQPTQDATCYQTHTRMPAEEKIASALLLLKRDPSYFEKLRDHHGTYYR